jgi:hypothetical protein
MKKGIPEYWAVDRESRTLVRFMPGAKEEISSALAWSSQGAAAVRDVHVEPMLKSCAIL